jgi:hypothetical protein
MDEVYRKDYDGEFVVTGVHVSNGKRKQTREWVDNPLNLKTTSGRAICVSNGASAFKFNLNLLSGKHGLLDTLGSNNYSTDEMYKHFSPNFHVTFNSEILQDLIDNELTEEIMVYTSNTQCINTPGEFFIIPYGKTGNSAAVAAYLAAFDGHKEVYLLGYDAYTADGESYRDTMIRAVGDVIKTYSGVKFFHVIDEGKTPEEWYPYRNVETITVAQFRSNCDISNGKWLRK